MVRTSFTDLVGCTVPIQMAGMDTLANPPLAAAVAEAGALGMLAWQAAPLDYLVRRLDETRRLTTGVFGINFIVDGWVDSATGELAREGVVAVKAAASRVRVVEFFWGDPNAELVEVAHSGGALATWQVGSLDEALQAGRVGCDFIIAQGVEAGGHVRGKVALSTLLSQVVPSVKVPVVAAGGIGSARAVADALASGAAGVRIGTRFVAATESEAHPRYVEKLIAAEAKDTTLTEAFSANWPNAPHRVLRECVAAMQRLSEEVVGEQVYPWAPDVRLPVHRGDGMVPLKSTTGRIDAMPHWAGESVGGVKRVQPAAEIIQELMREAEPRSRTEIT